MSRDTGRNVFLVPVDQQNFEVTVSSPIELDEYEGCPEEFQSLDETRLWGVKESDSSVAVFERMTPGDLILFYLDNTWIGVGRIGETFVDEDRWITRTFWTGKPAIHIFTVHDFSPLSIPREAVNAIFEYKPTYVPHRITRIAQNRVTTSLKAIELAVQRYNQSHSSSS